jgi:indoleacetamide hydrolase
VSAPRDPARRRVVLGAAASATAAVAGMSALKVRAASPALTDLGAGEAVALMARGDLRAEDYAKALLERCRAKHPLNAFITLEPDRVLEQARARDAERRAGAKPGALFGLPVPVKDSVNTADYPTTGGTRALRHFRPKADAPVVASLKGAGAIVLGKTNLHELSYGWTSNNLAFGAVHNPYDPARIPGGSSGGTAVAVATGMAPLGVAEDTEGSIRVPAAFCGIVGFRPTTGRYSTAACVPISPLFDQVGPLARSVADLTLFDTVLTGNTRPAPTHADLSGIRIGVVRDYWFTELDPEIERVCAAALRRLADAGVQFIEGTLPGLESLIELTTYPVQNHDVGHALPRYLRDYRTGVTLEQLLAQASPDIQAAFRSDVLPGGANFVTEEVYIAARDRHLPALRRLYADYFSRNGVVAMAFPTTRVPPPRIGDESTLDIRGKPVPFDRAVAANIAPGSTAGLPGLVLPAGLTSGGLPVSLEFDAPARSDAALLALGASLERALGPIPDSHIRGTA